MKKNLPSLLIGLTAGVAGTWLVLRYEVPAAKEVEPPPGLNTKINPDTATIVKQMAAVGLTTAEPTVSQVVPEVTGYGRVLDPTPLLTLVAEAAASEAAANASAREYERTKSLYDQDRNAPLQAVETTQAAMLRDQTQLVSARGRLAASWGMTLAKREGLTALVQSLAMGDAAIVRIDLPAGDTAAVDIKSARVSSATGDPAWHDVELLGPAATTESQFGGQSYIALWRNSPLHPGAAIKVVLTGSGDPQKVIVIQKNSIVRYNGGTFVYVQKKDGPDFERHMVELGPSLPSGTVVKSGVAEGDKVVVTGAQQMLSTEIMGAGASEE